MEGNHKYFELLLTFLGMETLVDYFLSSSRQNVGYFFQLVLSPAFRLFNLKRSTMSSWSEIQLEWAQRTEENKVTGVLLWDLTAAFDTLDSNILCQHT